MRKIRKWGRKGHYIGNICKQENGRLLLLFASIYGRKDIFQTDSCSDHRVIKHFYSTFNKILSRILIKSQAKVKTNSIYW